MQGKITLCTQHFSTCFSPEMETHINILVIIDIWTIHAQYNECHGISTQTDKVSEYLINYLFVLKDRQPT